MFLNSVEVAREDDRRELIRPFQRSLSLDETSASSRRREFLIDNFPATAWLDRQACMVRKKQGRVETSTIRRKTKATDRHGCFVHVIQAFQKMTA
jgi:hypothetical protein